MPPAGVRVSNRPIASLRPRYRTTRRRYKGYVSKRRGYRGAGPMVRVGGKPPMPAQLFTKFNYSVGYLNLSTSTLATGHTIRSNSLFDPDFSGVGSQPYMYDQLVGASGIYENYRVYGCKVTAKVKVRDASSLESCDVVLVGTRQGQALPNDIDQAKEMPRAKKMLVSKNHWKVFSVYFDQAALAGVSKNAYASDPDFSAGSGANPVSTNFVTLLAQSFDRTTNTLLDVDLQIKYYVVLFGYNTLSRS